MSQDIFDALNKGRDDVEKVYFKFGFKPKISGKYEHNFAGTLVNMETMVHTPDPPKIETVEWVFYSGDTEQNNANKVFIHASYHGDRMEQRVVLFHKYMKLPGERIGSTWLYMDDFERNREHYKKHEKWLYENPPFYSMEQSDYGSGAINKIQTVMFLLREKGSEFCLEDKVELDRAPNLRMILGQPLLHEKGYTVAPEEMETFAKNVWESLVQPKN